MVISKSMLHHSCTAISFLYINWRFIYYTVEEVLKAGKFFCITVNFATRHSDSWVYRCDHDFVMVLDDLERLLWPLCQIRVSWAAFRYFKMLLKLLPEVVCVHCFHPQLLGSGSFISLHAYVTSHI